MSQPDLVVRWKNSLGLRGDSVSNGDCAAHVGDGDCLQLGLGDAGGGGGGIHVRGGERGGGEVGVLAADGVGGGSAGDEEAGEDGDGLGDGGHFDVFVVSVWVG
jgi:hypothetical protein